MKFGFLNISLLLSFHIFISSLACGWVKCQDMQFSQSYAAPLYLNPALTGNTKQMRFASVYRNQWASIPGYVSYAFSYDHNLRMRNSGVGLFFNNDKAAKGALSLTGINALYSYKILVTRFKGINFGLRGGYVNRKLDKNKLLFGDQIIRNSSSTIETFPVEQFGYFDAAAGVVSYSPGYWLGVSADHLNRPEQSFLSSGNHLPVKFTVHGGAHFFETVKPTDQSLVSRLTLTGIYKAEKKWDQLDLGMYFRYSPLMYGIWYRGIPVFKKYKEGYRNNDAVALMLGINTSNIIFAYSYDITISKLSENTGGSHEISFIYEYVAPKFSKNMNRKKEIPCTKLIGVEF